jgi:hypothetical protein
MTLSHDSINFSFALINSRLVACNGPVSKRGSIWLNWRKEVGIQTPGEDLENLSRSFRDQAKTTEGVLFQIYLAFTSCGR